MNDTLYEEMQTLKAENRTLQQMIADLDMRYRQVAQELMDIRQQVDALTIDLKQPVPIQEDEPPSRIGIFKEKVETLLARTKVFDKKQKGDLAAALGLSAPQFSKKLNGMLAFSVGEIQEIIRIFIEWGAITSRIVVDELNDLMECPPFPQEYLADLEDVQAIAVSLKQQLKIDLGKLDPLAIKRRYDQDSLERFILDDFEPTYARVAVLSLYLDFGYRNKFVFNKVVAGDNHEFTLHILEQVRNRLIEIDVKILIAMLSSDNRDIAEKATRIIVKMLRERKEGIQVGDLLRVKHHSYWLIKQMAVRAIIEYDDHDSIKLLHEFKTISYHLARRLMREYIETRFERNTLSAYERILAKDILETHLGDNKSQKKTLNETQILLNKLSD